MIAPHDINGTLLRAGDAVAFATSVGNHTPRLRLGRILAIHDSSVSIKSDKSRVIYRAHAEVAVLNA